MGILKKDFKYKLIKNFFTQEETKIGCYYFLLRHKKNLEDFDFKQVSNTCDSSFYGDFFGDTMMIKKRPLIEKVTGLKLFPTYTFTRLYTFNADLKKHKDRPSCEVSISAMWGSCGTKWPIYMDDKPFEMEPGDAVVYLGCEVPHYRKPFTGDWHAQSFLHYVDQNGPYKDFKFDKRNAFDNPSINI